VTAATDTSGNFGFSWTPTVQGTYKVIAAFEGSNSYGGSSSTAYFVVGTPAATPAPVTTPTPTQASTSTPTPVPTTSLSPVPNTGLAIGTEVYIGIAAVVVFAAVAATALFLRKRK
jgi:hypothetical protein